MSPIRAISLLTGIVLTLLALQACGANSGQRIEVPSGDATITLLEFARQAKVEIIFDAQSVSGIQTQSVMGKHLPSEALDLMTTDTPLVVDQDEHTGAFAITRKT
ncbi:hypothetical protein [Pelagicoccus mobilis]|uniref:Iron complex transport system substrate-binding protein n=1 Tax=Pelagicoccus mobilis TaxID=415221 RepID=A0A934RRM3_9BACT|nr:hypothetical protein [Pelagicoccus mobilis]MBK1875627.1 hypothetical protein [Pelagicoccus mobilis]